MTKLQAERIRRQLTQTELAYHAKLSASEVSRFETGMARPYPVQAARLAAVLDMPADALLDDAGSTVEIRAVRR
jgi:transcriptional regulator with XRE-family HTH domain